ncbi:hypothetical protein B0H13DRAFT_1883540, partial [Mycena leptocephala]
MGKGSKNKRETAAKKKTAAQAPAIDTATSSQQANLDMLSTLNEPPDSIQELSQRRENGNQSHDEHRVREGVRASSPLPPITPSRSERAVTAMLSTTIEISPGPLPTASNRTTSVKSIQSAGQQEHRELDA